MNKVILTGRLTADPELRQTVGGISSCRFTVAVNRKYADKTTGERQADFISCTAWRQTAEFISRYFSKGKMIAIRGELQSRKYTDKNGEKRTAIEINVKSTSFCESASSGSSSTPSPEPNFEEIPPDENLPF